MNPFALVIVAATLAAAWVAARSWSVRQRALRRLYAEADEPGAATGVDALKSESALARWLARAGYRGANAPALPGTLTTMPARGVRRNTRYNWLATAPAAVQPIAAAMKISAAFGRR